MKILIKYTRRLGDIARCLPIARALSQEGDTVHFHCAPEYHQLFSFVSYALPCYNPSEKYDLTLDLEIWPDRYRDFRDSGMSWMDFVYDIAAQSIAGAQDWPRRIVFDKPIPETLAWVQHTAIVFPAGYSQVQPVAPARIMAAAHEIFSATPILMCGKKDLVRAAYEVVDVSYLVALIANAKFLLTVNSAPTVLASAVRQSWHHIPDSVEQDDFFDPRQIRIPV